ncbi:serine hydrolase [Alteribacter natronophilus]|uniref:serine hydrolase n=1 Tax=Alteribacter natronophilus TaxID=2583810 RepID=UPI001FE914C4|nr:serine hydrolase [Alteribacter natronophilus]
MTEYDNYVEKIRTEEGVPGVAVGLKEGRARLYERGYGYRNEEQKLPVTMDTVFGIASITKSFTCLAIMQLKDEGKLDVNDPVIRYIPDFARVCACAEDITIHHLMTHTSGLPPLPTLIYANIRSFEKDPDANDYPGIDIKKTDREPVDDYRHLIDAITEKDVKPLGKPGEAFSYSNDGYAILGAVIESVSGKSYERYVKEHILNPAGMTRSFFTEEELKGLDDVTELYAKKAEAESSVYASPVWWDAPAMRAAGYLKSTASDLLMYSNIYLDQGIVGGNRIVSEESLEEMMAPHVEIEPGRYYGYGFFITPDYFGNKLVEHGGSLKAISSQLSMIPEKGLSGVVLTNLAGVPASSIMNAAFNAAGGRDLQDRLHPLEGACTLTDEEKREYTGTYESMEGMNLSVQVEGSSLTGVSAGKDLELLCVEKDLFIAKSGEHSEYLRFIRDETGRVSQVAFHYRQFPKTGAVVKESAGLQSKK